MKRNLMIVVASFFVIQQAWAGSPKSSGLLYRLARQSFLRICSTDGHCAVSKAIPRMRVERQQTRDFFTVVKQFEKAPVFTFGKLTSVREPGLNLYLPFVQKMVPVDMRDLVVKFDGIHLVTKDNLSVSVGSIASYRIENVEKAVLNVSELHQSIQKLIQAEARNILGDYNFQDILHRKEELGERIAANLEKDLERWGCVLSKVTLDNVDLVDPNMVRAIARQVEAERERIAMNIRADGEIEAAEKLKQAAEVLGVDGWRLRQLETLRGISKEKNLQTIVVPADLFNAFQNLSIRK